VTDVRARDDGGSDAAKNAHAQHMARALARARLAGEAGEVPVGAVLVGSGGAVLAEAGNGPIARHDPTAHAEMLVLREAGAKLGNYRLPGTTLYVTLEPCPMCTGALVHARVARIVYGTPDPRTGACGSVFELARSPALNHRIEVLGGVAEQNCAALLKTFFAERR
jgi:tRNA(Arg) A34 adenosine deaminase TadA